MPIRMNRCMHPLKRLISFILLFLFVCSTAFADTDFSSATDEDLEIMLNQIHAEITRRDITSNPDQILLDYAGVVITLVSPPEYHDYEEIEGGYVSFDIIFCITHKSGTCQLISFCPCSFRKAFAFEKWRQPKKP